MYILSGVSLLAAAALLFSWALARTRAAGPGDWVRRDAFPVTVSLLFSSFLAFGIGFTAAGVAAAPAQIARLGVGGSAGTGAIAAVGLWGAAHFARVRRRAASPGPGPVIAFDPRRPTRGAPSGPAASGSATKGGTHRKAA